MSTIFLANVLNHKSCILRICAGPVGFREDYAFGRRKSLSEGFIKQDIRSLLIRTLSSSQLKVSSGRRSKLRPFPLEIEEIASSILEIISCSLI